MESFAGTVLADSGIGACTVSLSPVTKSRNPSAGVRPMRSTELEASLELPTAVMPTSRNAPFDPGPDSAGLIEKPWS